MRSANSHPRVYSHGSKCTHPELTWSRNCKLHWSKCPTANGCTQIPRFRYKHCTLRCFLPLRSGQHAEQQTCTEQTFNRHDVCFTLEAMGQLLWCFLPPTVCFHIDLISRYLLRCFVVSQIELRDTLLDNFFIAPTFRVVVKMVGGTESVASGSSTIIASTEKGKAPDTVEGEKKPQCGLCGKVASFAGVQWESYVSN